MFTITDATGAAKYKVDGQTRLVPPEIEDKTYTMLVGPTERGPAYVPITVRDIKQLESIFGLGETYVTYAAREALKETDRITIIRILHEDGWRPEYVNIYLEDGSDIKLLATFIPNDDLDDSINVQNTDVTGTLDEFTVDLKDDDGDVVNSFKVSFNRKSKTYISNIFNESNSTGFDLYFNFYERQQTYVNEDITTQVFGHVEYFETNVGEYEHPLDFDETEFTYAKTPWILSQTIFGDIYPLFRFVATSAGYSENRRVKIGIKDINETNLNSEYQYFTVQIRDISDTDFRPIVLEEYKRVTLDPNDDRYIAKIIGDTWYEVRDNRVISRGNFPNNSDYIRIEMHPDFQKAGSVAQPYGFDYIMPTVAGELLDWVPPVSFRTEQSIGNITDYLKVVRPAIGRNLAEKIFYGFDYENEDNFNYLNPIPKPFGECHYLDPYLSDEDASEICDPSLYLDIPHDKFLMETYVDIETSDIEERKFLVPLQGGFDGTNPMRRKKTENKIASENYYGIDCSSVGSEGVRMYKKAFNMLEEITGGYEYNLLLTPGIIFKLHKFVVYEAEKLVRNRSDALYVFDLVSMGDNYTEAIDYSNRFESKHAATYFGWLNTKNYDPNHDWVPASAVIPKVFNRSDQLTDPWFAPSGFRRGVIFDVQDVEFRLTENQMDNLYDNFVNPINYFGSNGVCIWGQKLLYPVDQKTNRVNIRRLIVTVKSEVRRLARQYLFEPNISANIDAFRNGIRDYLSNIRANQGLYNYSVDIEDPDQSEFILENEHLIEGTINLMPVDSNEYVFINFTVEQELVLFKENDDR